MHTAAGARQHNAQLITHWGATADATNHTDQTTSSTTPPMATGTKIIAAPKAKSLCPNQDANLSIKRLHASDQITRMAPDANSANSRNDPSKRFSSRQP